MMKKKLGRPLAPPWKRRMLGFLHSQDATDPTAPILRAWACELLAEEEARTAIGSAVGDDSVPKLELRSVEFHAKVRHYLALRAAHDCPERVTAEVPSHSGPPRDPRDPCPPLGPREPRECPERLAFPDAHVADGTPSAFERVEGGPGWSLLGLVRREIVSRFGQGLGWDLPFSPGALSLDAAIALVEKLTIDGPVRPDANVWKRPFRFRRARAQGGVTHTHTFDFNATLEKIDVWNCDRQHLVEWATCEFWPRWLAWCLDLGWSRPVNSVDLRLVHVYEQVHAVLEELKDKGAVPPGAKKTLRQMLETRTPRPLVEFDERPGLDPSTKIELPPNWRQRPWQTPEEFAVASVAHAYRTNSRKIKERLGHARREHTLTKVWQDYRRWLAKNPGALRELEQRLGLLIATP